MSAQMINGLGNFMLYMAVSFVFWGVAMRLYVLTTPYKEFELIKAGNMAAAWSLGGTGLGMALPLASLIAHSISVADMAIWAVIALVVQLLTWWVIRMFLVKNMKDEMERGNVAVGVMLGAFSLAVGVLNAACLTY